MHGSTPGNPLLEALHLPRAQRAATPIARLGDYRVLEIRRGGMGEVFICLRPDDDELVLALKTFRKHLFFDPASRRRFLREVAIWMRLAGGLHVMPVLGLEQIEDRLFVQMPALERSLRDTLAAGPVTGEAALRVALQPALALRDGAERLGSLVHGDLKPENILLAPAGLLVSDFGLARVAEEDAGLELEGTWAYRAPECWRTGVTSTASDLYAYGVILLEALAGRRPFEADTRDGWEHAHAFASPQAAELDGGDIVARDLLALALRCLAKRPEDRPESFAEVCAELMAVGERADPVGSLIVLHESALMKHAFAAVAEESLPTVIAGLLRLEEFDLALAELANVPSERLTPGLLRLYGDALSLTGRDEAAVERFAEALDAGPDDAERRQILLSYGLSLKRLGRLDDAIAAFERLRDEVPDELLPPVVANLATVFLARGDPDEAVELLLPASRAHPDVPELWANLGLAQEERGRLEESVDAFGRAVAVAPHRPELQVMLARVALRLGWLQVAAGALEAAHAQGFMEPEWLMPALALSVLADDTHAVNELTMLVRDHVRPEDAARLEADAQALVEQARQALLDG